MKEHVKTFSENGKKVKNYRGTRMNIYDIAKEAGVSIATVSRVMNNKGYVSEKTRAKIQKVLEENEYRPSAIAQGLVSGSMKTVAIMVVDLRVPHYSLTAYTMEQILSKQGYMVIVCNTGDDPAQWDAYLRRIANQKPDGIVLVGSIYDKLANDDALNAVSGIPIVMANGQMEGHANVHSVIVDETRGVELATAHMYERGHEKIAFVMDKDTDAARRKAQGFVRQMKILGFTSPEKDVFKAPYGLEGGEHIGPELYDKGYTGIVFGEDLTAVGAVNALCRRGVKIPEEIGISGHNNSEYAFLCRPALTSVNNKGQVLSELTVNLLLDLMNHKKETASLVVLPELVVRETT